MLVDETAAAAAVVVAFVDFVVGVVAVVAVVVAAAVGVDVVTSLRLKLGSAPSSSRVVVDSYVAEGIHQTVLPLLLPALAELSKETAGAVVDVVIEA